MAPALSHAQVLRLLAARQGLFDPRYFVGRAMDVGDLQGCIGCTGSGWISGPRRIGKSTLARRIADLAIEEGHGTVVIDASGISGQDFDALLTRVVEECQDRRTSGDTPMERFESLARTARKQPLLVVLDEFDHIAVNLSGDHQAFLRRLSGDNPRFQYLFVSRADPYRVVEEVPDLRSRLLGICTICRVRPLERKDVVDLCSRVAADLEVPGIKEQSGAIWERVGGHTVAVVTLLGAIVVADSEGLLATGSAGAVADDKREHLENLVAGFWRDLSPNTRAGLLRRADEELSEQEKTAMKRDRVTDLRLPGVATWILAQGHILGVVPAESSFDSGSTRRFALVERLQSLIVEVNATARRQNYPIAFQVTDEALRVYNLTRERPEPSVLVDAAEHLYKLLYEGGRDTKGDKPWRIPAPLLDPFRKGEGLQAIECIRHFHDHDPNARSSPRRSEVRFLEVGDLYERLCRCRNPVGVQWIACRDRLLYILADEMEALRAGYAGLPLAAGRDA